MNGFGTAYLDASAILMLDATRMATRDAALRFRETLRAQLRAFEDMHNLPHSFQTKTEREIEERKR